MNNKKQSSVEWLAEKYNIITWMRNLDEMSAEKADMLRESFLKQAKAMHKEEIIESYCQGCFDITKNDAIFPRETSEQYYKETFEE